MRSPALIGAALAGLVALILHSAVARPARIEVGVLLGQQDDLRHDLGRQRQRLAALENDEAARRLALERLGGVDLETREAVTEVRRSLLASIDHLALEDVQVSVQPGRGTTAASVSLHVSATLDGLVSLSETMARPGSGIALQRARISSGPDRVLVEIHGASLRQAKP